MGTDEKLAALAGLSELFPFYRCPSCKDRDKQTIIYTITFGVPVSRTDNPSKTFWVNDANLEASEPDGVVIHCDNCGTRSPLPEGWSFKYI